MAVFVTGKIKNEGVRLDDKLNIIFSYTQEYLMEFKLIQAMMHALAIFKKKEDPLKIEGAREVTIFLPL